MLEFITKFFRREEASKTLAKERLRLVLMSDRISLAPELFDEMKIEMLSVIRRYLEIDERALDMHFENLERQFALLASIPVLKVKTREQVALQHALLQPNAYLSASANGNGTAPSTNGTIALDAAPHAPDGTQDGASSPPPKRRRRRRRHPMPPPDGSAPPGASPPA
jgi:cell division topological specificity factor